MGKYTLSRGICKDTQDSQSFLFVAPDRAIVRHILPAGVVQESQWAGGAWEQSSSSPSRKL